MIQSCQIGGEIMPRPKIVDVHSHFVLPAYYEAVEKSGRLMEDGFPIPVWAMEKHLEMMDKAGIRWSLLSLSSPNYYAGDEEACRKVTRILNEELAGYKEQYRENIGFCACLPLPDIDASIEEALYACNVLKADGFRMASNTAGMYLGDPKMEPLMKVLDDLGAVITIHPVKPSLVPENIFTSGPVPLFEFICDTTRAVLNLIANGVLERYKNLKIIVPHNGSFLPNIYQRIYGIAEVLAPKGLMQKVDVRENVNRLYFDMTGDPAPDVLDFLLTVADPKKVMYGSDYPFNHEEMVLRKIGNLERYLSVQEGLLPYKEDLLYRNAERLFHI